MSFKIFQENLAYYHGDHFKSWVGPRIPASVANAAEKMAEIERVFQSANLIAECVDNWRDGLISEDFTWYLKDKSGKRVEAAAAEVQLQRWLDWVKQQSLATDPTTKNFKRTDAWSEFILSLGVTGQGNLRLWQPDRYANDPDPIHRIHLHSPKAGSVTATYDDESFLESLTYSYGQGNREVQRLNDRGELEVYIETATGEAKGEPLVIDTGGRWTMQQVVCDSLFTHPIKQKQNSINHALTMKLRNQELSGFRERTFLNAQSPGEWVDDPTAPGGQKFIPASEPLERGPGYDNYVYGIPTGDAANPTYANAQVHESQPVEVKTFREGIEIDRILMYLEFKQGHLLGAGDGGLSGESRIQMRQGFELFLKGWKRPVESAIANILNIVLRILGYSELEAVVELKITTGKLSAEERDQLIKEFQAGLLSKATAIAKLGSVQDVDAELALIEEEVKEATQRRSPLGDPFEVEGDSNGTDRTDRANQRSTEA